MYGAVVAVALVSMPALAAEGQAKSSLTSKAKAAFADITKAKSALNAGDTKKSDGWLAKAETLLKTVMAKKGGGALAKTNTASDAAENGDSQKTTSALSQAESAAAKLDPSIAQRLGAAKQESAQGDTNGASGTLAEAKSAIAQKTGLSGIQDTYEKVTMARSLLKGGDSTKAKGVLDQIPTSATDLLKGL
jgi:uncharacterized protein HemY